MSPRPTVLVVANRRNHGFGRITRFWSRSVSLPSASSTRWITNITSGRPASYSSNTSATGCWSAHGSSPSRNSVTCWPSRRTIASRPTRSIRLICASRLTRIIGQLSRAATCSMWVDLPGAVIALDHHSAVLREARADGERGVRIEDVGRIEVGHALVGLAEGGHLHVRIDAERVADLHHLVGGGHQRLGAAFGLHVGKIGHKKIALGDGVARLNLRSPFREAGRA